MKVQNISFEGINIYLIYLRKSVHVTISTLYVYIYGTKYIHTGRPDVMRRLQTVAFKTLSLLRIIPQYSAQSQMRIDFYARGHNCKMGVNEHNDLGSGTELDILKSLLSGSGFWDGLNSDLRNVFFICIPRPFVSYQHNEVSIERFRFPRLLRPEGLSVDQGGPNETAGFHRER